MKHTAILPVLLMSLAAPAPLFAEAPRIITLQGSSDSALPGAHDGAKHGIVVRRGSRFPEPIVIEIPEEVVEETPAPVRTNTKKKKRKRGW